MRPTTAKMNGIKIEWKINIAKNESSQWANLISFVHSNSYHTFEYDLRIVFASIPFQCSTNLMPCTNIVRCKINTIREWTTENRINEVSIVYQVNAVDKSVLSKMRLSDWKTKHKATKIYITWFIISPLGVCTVNLHTNQFRQTSTRAKQILFDSRLIQMERFNDDTNNRHIERTKEIERESLKQQHYQNFLPKCRWMKVVAEHWVCINIEWSEFLWIVEASQRLLKMLFAMNLFGFNYIERKSKNGRKRAHRQRPYDNNYAKKRTHKTLQSNALCRCACECLSVCVFFSFLDVDYAFPSGVDSNPHAFFA